MGIRGGKRLSKRWGVPIMENKDLNDGELTVAMVRHLISCSGFHPHRAIDYEGVRTEKLNIDDRGIGQHRVT